MNVKLTRKELVDLIVDILTNLELEADGESVSFHKLNDESELGEQEASIAASTEKSITRGKANPLW